MSMTLGQHGYGRPATDLERAAFRHELNRAHDGTPLSERAVLIAAADWFDDRADAAFDDPKYQRICRGKAAALKHEAYCLEDDCGLGRAD